MLMFLSQVRWFESRVRRATAMVQCLMKHVCITGYYRRVSGRRNTVDRNRYRSRQPCFEKPLDLLELTPKKNHAPFCSPPHQKVVPSFRILGKGGPKGNLSPETFCHQSSPRVSVPFSSSLTPHQKTQQSSFHHLCNEVFIFCCQEMSVNPPLSLSLSLSLSQLFLTFLITILLLVPSLSLSL